MYSRVACRGGMRGGAGGAAGALINVLVGKKLYVTGSRSTTLGEGEWGWRVAARRKCGRRTPSTHTSAGRKGSAWVGPSVPPSSRTAPPVYVASRGHDRKGQGAVSQGRGVCRPDSGW